MIYLIGGTPRCGKSSVAKFISNKTGYPYIQTDYIASAIESKMTEQQEHELLGEKMSNKKYRKNNEMRFSFFSNAEQLEMYRIKAEWNWQGVRNIIDYMIADHETYVIEGFHLRPEVIAPYLYKWGNKVKYIGLHKSNIQEIETGLQSNKHTNDRAVKNTYKPETYNKIASFIYDFGQLVKNDCIKYGLEQFDMSQGDFIQNLEIVANKLMKDNGT